MVKTFKFEMTVEVAPECDSLVPHGTGTLLGQSHLNVSKLNLRPCGHSPLFVFF
jgi:hypothetical protein